MLNKIDHLPENVIGISASGDVTMADYENVLMPQMNEARESGRPVSLLYHFASDFHGLTAGAVLDDLRLGLKNIGSFKRVALVSDGKTVQTIGSVLGKTVPFPIRAFNEDQMTKALNWLKSPPSVSKLGHQLIQNEVLIFHPNGKLKREDFNKCSELIDRAFEGGSLRGFVVKTRTFPGWDSVGSLIRHLMFVRDIRKIRPRVAFVTESLLPVFASKVMKRINGPELKRFPYDQTEEAIKWIREGNLLNESKTQVEPPKESLEDEIQ